MQAKLIPVSRSDTKDHLSSQSITWIPVYRNKVELTPKHCFWVARSCEHQAFSMKTYSVLQGLLNLFQKNKKTFFLENVLTSKAEFVCSAFCRTQMSIKWYSSIGILHGFNHFSRKKYQQTACFLLPQLTCAEMCIRVHDYVKEQEIPYFGGRKLHSWLWVNTPVNHIRICLLWKGNTDNFIRICY